MGPDAFDPIMLALTGCELFRTLPRAPLQRVAGSSALRHHRRGARIWERGDASTELVLVVRGRLQCTVEAEGAPRQWVPSFPEDGAWCGLSSVLVGTQYLCSLRALEDATLLHIPRATIADLLAANHTFALRVAASLASRLRDSLSQTESMALRSPLQRLARLLLDLTDDGAWCPLPGTQHQIAAQLGTVREVVGRGLRKLETDGVLEREGRSIRILRRGDLQQILA